MVGLSATPSASPAAKEKADANGEAEQCSPSTPPTLSSILRSMPACFLIVALFWSGQWTQLDLFGGFFRSTISCDTPIPSGNPPVCPTGSLYQAGTCAPVPRGENAWSGSAHCFDQAYVVRTATSFGGRVTALSTAGQLIANLFLGSIIIDTCGRKPMMVIGLLSFFMLTGVLAISCYVDAGAQRSLIYCAGFLASWFNAFEAASNAMASDTTESDEVRRSLAMTLINVMKEVGVLGGFVGGYFVLNADLEDYAVVWWVIAGLFLGFALLAMAILTETMRRQDTTALLVDGQGARSALAPRNKVTKVFRDIADAFRIVVADPYLFWNIMFGVVLSYLSIFGAISICGSWGISICKYNQAIASLMGIWQPFCIVTGSMVSSSIIKAFGPYLAWVVGVVLIGAGVAIVGIGAFVPDMLWLVRLLWWGGFGGVMGFGIGISGPCINGILSARVPDSAQGKLFSMLYFFGTFGTMVGNYTFSNYVFANEGTPLRMAAGWFLSGGLQAVILAVFSVTYLLYIRPTRNSAFGVPPLSDRLNAAGSFITGSMVEPIGEAH